MDEEILEVIKAPVCIKCEHEWQKGYALGLFELVEFYFQYQNLV
ncbi:hypothetical protein [Flavicella sp.]